MQLNPEIKELQTQREFYVTKMNLTDKMHIFYLFEPNLSESKAEFWIKFLNSLYSKFSTILGITILKNEEKNQGLMKLFSEETITTNAMILVHPHMEDPQKFINIAPFEIYQLAIKFENFYKNEFNKEKEKAFKVIEEILCSSSVVAFIKGIPQDPFCKFSKKLVELLNDSQIEYKTINVLKDTRLKNFLKLYSGWKTFPQVFINQKLVGGVDVITDLIEKGVFLELIPDNVKFGPIKKELQTAIKEFPFVILCNKNNPCLETLRNKGLNFKHFDSVEDKRYSLVFKFLFQSEVKEAVIVNGVYVGDTKFLVNIFK